MNYSTNLEEAQVNGLYRGRKLEAIKMAGVYRELAELYPDVYAGRAEAILHCCDTLLYQRNGEQSHLVRANSCRVRLCPWCAYKRSLRAYAQNMTAYAYICSHPELSLGSGWLLLTLTVRNVEPDRLYDEVRRMLGASSDLQRHKEVKRAWLGAARGLEVTYNREAGTFHPHIHYLVYAAPGYFGRGYIKRERYAEIWKGVMGLDYIPVCDVRKVHNPDGAVAEVSKYVVKMADVLSLPESEAIPVIDTLADAIHGRRMISYTGAFKAARRDCKLGNVDAIDGTEDGESISQEAREVLYRWHYGMNEYKRDSSY